MLPRCITFRSYPKYPALIRDLSIIVDKDIESRRIMDLIEKEGRGLVEKVNLFDLYEGDRLDPAKKAIAFRLSYRSSEKTLDGGTVNSLHEKIIQRIRKETGGALKEG